VKVIVGNKIDLTEEEQVLISDADAYAKVRIQEFEKIVIFPRQILLFSNYQVLKKEKEFKFGIYPEDYILNFHFRKYLRR